MGYYVRIVKSTAMVLAENLDRVYQIMCELNNHNELKYGGSWSGGKQTEWWFSWMDANYPETCKDAFDIFKMLGFECDYDEQGNLHLIDYDQKTGQEDLFLKAITNYMTGMIRWVGEEGDVWDTEFDGDKIIDAVADRLAIEKTKEFLRFISPN